MENSTFEAIYIAISTFIFIAALSAAISLFAVVRDTADLAIEKVNNLEYNVLSRPLDYNKGEDQNIPVNETNIVDITIIKGNEILSTYVESVKKKWVNKNYEFQIYSKKNNKYVLLDEKSIQDVVVNKKYRKIVEPTVNLINYDKGYQIDKVIIKYIQEGVNV